MVASLTCCPVTWPGSFLKDLLWVDHQGFWLVAGTGLLQLLFLITHLLLALDFPPSPVPTALVPLFWFQSTALLGLWKHAPCPQVIDYVLVVCPLSLAAQFTHTLLHIHIQPMSALCQACSYWELICLKFSQSCIMPLLWGLLEPNEKHEIVYET